MSHSVFTTLVCTAAAVGTLLACHYVLPLLIDLSALLLGAY